MSFTGRAGVALPLARPVDLLPRARGPHERLDPMSLSQRTAPDPSRVGAVRAGAERDAATLHERKDDATTEAAAGSTERPESARSASAGAVPRTNASEGRVCLRRVIRSVGARVVAARLAVPLRWVRSWWFGNRAPEPRLRVALSERFGVPLAAWERPAQRRRVLRSASTMRAAA